jgi:hypothetical protein
LLLPTSRGHAHSVNLPTTVQWHTLTQCRTGAPTVTKHQNFVAYLLGANLEAGLRLPLSDRSETALRTERTGGASSTKVLGSVACLIDENRMAAAIRRVRGLIFVVQQYEWLAKFGVLQQHPARIANGCICRHADDVVFGKLLVRKTRKG